MTKRLRIACEDPDGELAASDAEEASVEPTTPQWKTGRTTGEDGKRRRLSAAEIDRQRRERNRLHAKMTRDRKKLFVSAIEQTIVKLEEENKFMSDGKFNSRSQHGGSEPNEMRSG